MSHEECVGRLVATINVPGKINMKISHIVATTVLLCTTTVHASLVGVTDGLVGVTGGDIIGAPSSLLDDNITNIVTEPGDWIRVITASAVPVPAAVWLFGTALLGFIGMSRKTNVS
jgi:hypothetical protein